MGTMILVIAIIIEIAFSVFCICTKSLNKNIRSIMRIGSFLVFIILILTSVIDLNFRWKWLSALLLVWGIMGCISLIKVRSQGRTVQIGYKRGRVIRKAVAALLLVAIALIPALVFTEHELIKTIGQYKVATAIYTYTDENRMETYTDTGENRKLNVEFWYLS